MGKLLSKEKGQFSADDINGLNRALFELFDSYDLKDWKRLRSNITPTVMVDYSKIGLQDFGSMSVDEYLKMITAPTFLGDPLTKTQHLVGATWYERVSPTEAVGHHQVRAAHMVYADASLQTETLKGHAHATNQHRYSKVGAVWKFSGIKPSVHSSEFNFAAVWARDPASKAASTVGTDAATRVNDDGDGAAKAGGGKLLPPRLLRRRGGAGVYAI